MDLRSALGQCFWIGINGTTADESSTQEIFRKFQPGGVCLFHRNIESFEQVQTMNADLQRRSAVPLFIAVDQEGGNMERLYPVIGSLPPAMAFAAARSKRLIREIHGAHARLLSAMNFNVNFAPVLDLALSDYDNGLGTRCFSDDPRIVVRCAREMIRAHAEAGILISGKHFPGAGETSCDPHVALPTVARSWDRIFTEDLFPYRRLKNELPFIMIGHGVYPDMNPALPASLAPEIITGLLRKEMRYRGLIVSDDLIMGAVTHFYDKPEAAERAFEAGNDLLLICVPEGVSEAYERLLARAHRDAQFAARIVRTSQRIVKFKRLLRETGRAPVDFEKEISVLRAATDRLARKAVTRIRGGLSLDLPESCTLFLPASRWFQGGGGGIKEYLEGRGCKIQRLDFSVRIAESEAIDLAGYSTNQLNIVVEMNSFVNGGQRALLEALVARKKRVSVIHSGFPIDQLPAEIENSVAAYWRSPVALEEAAAVLFGARKAKGQSPVKSAVLR